MHPECVPSDLPTSFQLINREEKGQLLEFTKIYPNPNLPCILPLSFCCLKIVRYELPTSPFKSCSTINGELGSKRSAFSK